MTIKWSHEKRLLSNLKPYPHNPRTITKAKFKELVNKIKNNGYINRLIITRENEVLGGNQRLQALQNLGYTEIDVLVPDVTLTQEQTEEINVSDNISAGDWDTDMLSSLFDAEKLIEWGIDPLLVGKSVLTVKDEDKIKEKKAKTCPACGELL